MFTKIRSMLVVLAVASVLMASFVYVNQAGSSDSPTVISHKAIDTSWRIYPPLTVGPTLAEIQQTQANIAAGLYDKPYDAIAYENASTFDGSMALAFTQ